MKEKEMKKIDKNFLIQCLICVLFTSLIFILPCILVFGCDVTHAGQIIVFFMALIFYIVLIASGIGIIIWIKNIYKSKRYDDLPWAIFFAFCVSVCIAIGLMPFKV